MGYSLLLLGCGKMGGALARGWLAAESVRRLRVVDPQPLTDPVLAADSRLAWVPNLESLDDLIGLDAVFLAVKPQQMDEALVSLVPKITGNPLVLSIAAGKTIAYLEHHFKSGQPIIRAMPNLPVAIGRGVTVCVATHELSDEHRAFASELLSVCGAVEWVSEEKQIDAVTALSGGGPAYVFALIEAMTEAGVAVGLSADLAERLARVTVAGAGELVRRSDLSAPTLREAVCSPGGTTLEAIRHLTGPNGWQPIITNAIAAATRRAEELGR